MLWHGSEILSGVDIDIDIKFQSCKTVIVIKFYNLFFLVRPLTPHIASLLVIKYVAFYLLPLQFIYNPTIFLCY